MVKQTVHEEVMQVLPWFVNESLDDRERLRVLAHLRECPGCQRERDELQAMQLIVSEDDGNDSANYKFAFKKLMARIEVAEANRESTEGFDSTKRFGFWGAGVAAAASIALVVVFVMNAGPDTSKVEGDFTTLTSTPALVITTTSEEPVAHRVALTFEQPIKAETLRSAFIETRSNIVSGPDANGTYIVEVGVPEHMTDAEFIDSMRSIDGVQYAAFDGHADTHP